MEVITDSQEELFRAIKYANYLKARSVEESGEIDVAELTKLSVDSSFNTSDRDVNMSPTEDEMEACKSAFDKICVFPFQLNPNRTTSGTSIPPMLSKPDSPRARSTSKPWIT